MARSRDDGPLGDLAHAMKFAVCCVLAAPVVYVLSVVVTTAWYEHVYLPLIAGED